VPGARGPVPLLASSINHHPYSPIITGNTVLWVALVCFGLLWVALGCFGLLWLVIEPSQTKQNQAEPTHTNTHQPKPPSRNNWQTIKENNKSQMHNVMPIQEP